jgi:hypothetical protein
MTRADRTITPAEYRGELLRVFKAGEDDLVANRQGLLSPGQRQRMVRSGYIQLALAVVGGVALMALVFAVADKPMKPIQYILAFGLAAVLLAIGAVYCLRANADAASGTVEVVAGTVYKQMRGRAGWYLIVGDRSFKLPVQPWHVQNDAAHRLYVTPKAKRVIAMEPDGWA